MAGLVPIRSRRQIPPGSTRTKDPQHAIEQSAGIVAAATTPVGSLPMLLVLLHEGIDVLPLSIGEVS